LGQTILDYVNDINSKVASHDSQYDSTSAYDLAYTQRVAERVLWSIIDGLDTNLVLGACRYAALNGPGVVDIWSNEFDEVNVGGLRIFESEAHRGLQANLNCGSDGINIWANINVNFDRSSNDGFKDSIRSAWRAAEDDARELEMAGLLSGLLETFTISDDNRVIGDEVIALVDDLAAVAASVELNAESIYSFHYDSVVKRAEIEGLTNSLGCDALGEIGPYVIIYSAGDVEVRTDEFGEVLLPDWKLLFENDFLRISFNSWCDEFSGDGNLYIFAEWGQSVTRDSTYASAVRDAEQSAQREADRLRRKGMVIEARKLYTFSLEEELIGQTIINRLTDFKEKIINFDVAPSAQGAYDLEYESVLLSAEVEGLAQAYDSSAKMIGTYVMLYGPGVPDVWRDYLGELSVGGRLSIYEGNNSRFEFNSWFDDYEGRGGFNTWLNFGQLRVDYRDEIRQAELDAWVEADNVRRRGLTIKKRSELEADGVSANNVVDALTDYLTVFNKYLGGTATAFEVELKRLQVNDLMRDVNESLRDYFLVADLGDNVPSPDIWLEWDTNSIMVGGWRELVKFNKSLAQPFTGLSGWCDWRNDDLCGAELHIDWVNWSLVRQDIDRANELFWRQKREAELTDVLSGIISTKSAFSAEDQSVADQLVGLINDLDLVGGSFDASDVENFQYDLLLKQDALNDLLNTAVDQRVIETAVAEVSGFHEFDDWANMLRGVVVFVGDDIEIAVRVDEVFTPFFLEGESVNSVEYELSVDIIWKDWSADFNDALVAAFERYELEQSDERFSKLVERRSEFAPSDITLRIEALVDDYETGLINMTALKVFVNDYYYRLMGYDNEVAYLAALSNNSYPSFELVNVVINTEHVNLQLYEASFSYRFGGAVRFDNDLFRPSADYQVREIDIMSTELVNSNQGATQVTGRLVLDPGMNNQLGMDNQGSSDDRLLDNSFEAEQWDSDLLTEIEGEKQELVTLKQESIRRSQETSNNVLDNRKTATGLTSTRLSITGVKPKLRFSVDLTVEEVRRLADSVKSQWNDLMDSGMIYDIVYNINSDIDSFPSLQEAIREWGDVTTSVRLKYQNESVFEISFTTYDGYIDSVSYGIIDGAGVDPNTVLIELDFESLMALKNTWEQGFKNADNFFEVITALPGMFNNIVGMLLGGDIVIQPFGVVFRIPSLLKVLFEAMMQSSGINL
jgi:hypothetical protein